MGDKLTDHERAAIDAAMQAGKVKVIPAGVSGIPVDGFHWRHHRDAVMRRYRHVGRMRRVIEREKEREDRP
jgi:hypothetical protein